MNLDENLLGAGRRSADGATVAAASGHALLVGAAQYAVGGVLCSLVDAIFPDPNVDAPTAAIAAEMGLQVAATASVSVLSSTLLVDTIDPNNIMGGMMFFMAAGHAQPRLRAKASVMWTRFSDVVFATAPAVLELKPVPAVVGGAVGLVVGAIVFAALGGKAPGVITAVVLGPSATVLAYHGMVGASKPLTGA